MTISYRRIRRIIRRAKIEAIVDAQRARYERSRGPRILVLEADDDDYCPGCGGCRAAEQPVYH